MREAKKSISRSLWVLAVLTGVLLCLAKSSRPVLASDGLCYDYIVPDADVRYLSEDEISYMSLQTICYAKNEIYARRGWIFSSQELQDYFGRQAWYIPRLLPSEFSDSIMNTYEVANAKLLQKRENQLSSSGYQLDRAGYNFDAVYNDLYGIPYSEQGDFGYVIPGSDLEYLTEDDVWDLSAQELCYARNEIYARHGRLFNSSELTGFFNQKSWYYGYISPSEFSESVFNVYEKANTAFLLNYERKVYGEYKLDQSGYNYTLVRSLEDNGSSPYTDSGSYIFPDSDCRYLTDAEVSGYSAQWLCYAKNEIYARHGRIFDSKELRDYFNSQSWYFGWVEPEEFSSAVFNEYELANIELLKKYEYQYAPGGYQLYK
ncbi:MAG: YARHG domain-containing protein [Lachnospiraceae bacterium]|nr:YARHG domain-containing protein [Lachnospiraceae bacterium]